MKTNQNWPELVDGKISSFIIKSHSGWWERVPRKQLFAGAAVVLFYDDLCIGTLPEISGIGQRSRSRRSLTLEIGQSIGQMCQIRTPRNAICQVMGVLNLWAACLKGLGTGEVWITGGIPWHVRSFARCCWTQPLGRSNGRARARKHDKCLVFPQKFWPNSEVGCYGFNASPAFVRHDPKGSLPFKTWSKAPQLLVLAFSDSHREILCFRWIWHCTSLWPASVWE